MKRLFALILCMLMAACFSVCVFAVEEDFEELVEGDFPSGESPDNSSDWLSLLPSSSELPIVTPESDDIQLETNSQDNSINSDSSVTPRDATFGGSWSGSITDYFEGFVLNNSPFEHYLAFRQSQYIYLLYCGDIKYNNGVFSGSSLTCVTYNVYNYNNQNEYVSIDRNATLYYSNDGYFYSDMKDGASFTSVTLVRFMCGLGVLLTVLIVIRLFGSLFKR